MSKRALVVDNDFFFVEFLTELLEERGYEVAKAYDGKEGISKLEGGSFDLIFVDLIMPKIDGRQFIEFVRRRYPDATFPIITMSEALIEQLDNIKEIGADYYLAKGPMETMTEHVSHLIDRVKKQPFPGQEAATFLESGKLYPRQVTGELMEKVNFQRAIIESIGIGIMVIDRDARIMSSNSLALKIMNRSLEEVLNRPITSVFPLREKARLVMTLKEIISNRTLRKLVFTATVNAQEIRIIVSALKVNGKIAGWIITMEDSDQWVEQA